MAFNPSQKHFSSSSKLVKNRSHAIISKINNLYLSLLGEDSGNDTEDDLPNKPAHKPGQNKYCGFRAGGIGLFSARSFPSMASLSPRLVQVIVQCSNNSLSQNTWKQVFAYFFVAFVQFVLTNLY